MDIGSLTGAISIEDQFSEHFTTAIEKVKEFAEEFEGMTGAVIVGVGAVTAAIMGMVVTVTALGEEGSKILGVENAFDHLAEAAGTTGSALRESLSEGVRGTITELQLMESTSKLLGSGMALTTEQASLMGSAARELGKATGGDATSGLDMLSSALVTGRVRGLQQQIGLIDLAAGEQKFADSIGTTVSQLNEEGKLEGKRLAIFEATQSYLDRLGVSQLSFAEKVKQGWTALEEWGETLAKSVASSPDVMEALDAVSAAIAEAFGSTSQSLLDLFVDGINAFSRGVTAAVPYVVSFGQGVRSVWGFLQENQGVILDAVRVVTELGAAWALWEIGSALITGITSGMTAIVTGIEAITLAIALNPIGAFAIAAVAAGVALDVYAQSLAKATPSTQQATVDATNLTRINTTLGTSFTDLTEATKAATLHNALLQGGNADLGMVVGSTMDQINAQSKSLDDNSKYLKNNHDALQALTDKWTDGGKSIKLIEEAFGSLSSEQLKNVQVQEQLIPDLDKILKAHQALTPAMNSVYDAAIASKQALMAEDMAILSLGDVTAGQIAQLKEQGITGQALARILGITLPEAADKLTSKEKETFAFEQDMLGKAQTSWASYAKSVEDSLSMSVYDRAKSAINSWQISQQEAIDKWVADQVEKQHGLNASISAGEAQQTTAMKLEYAQRLANLNTSTQLMDKTSHEYYEKQAADAQAEYESAQRLLASDNIGTATQVDNLRKIADARRIDADNWLPWSGAGKTAADTVTGAMNQVPGAINTVTSAVQSMFVTGLSQAQVFASGMTATMAKMANDAVTTFAEVSTSVTKTSAEAVNTITLQMKAPGSPAEVKALMEVDAQVNQSSVGQALKFGTQSVTAMNAYDAAVDAGMVARGFMPSHEDGGPIDVTGPAMIHQGEYVVPKDGALVMAGGGGGGPQVIQLVVDGAVLAQVVADRQSRQTLQGRKMQ